MTNDDITDSLMGHNGAPDETPDSTDVSGDERLRLLVERVERLEDEKKGIAEDIRDVYAEAKAVGYCTKTIRQVIKIRKMDADKRAEEQAILDTYLCALGLA